jgi:hypothetical protein
VQQLGFQHQSDDSTPSSRLFLFCACADIATLEHAAVQLVGVLVDGIGLGCSLPTVGVCCCDVLCAVLSLCFVLHVTMA